MVVMSSSNICNFGKEIITISKTEQRFGHEIRGNLELKGHAKCSSLRLKNNIAKITASGFKNVDSDNPRQLDMINDDSRMGELLNNGLVFQHRFLIKAYESGLDKNMAMFFIINQLQESKLNHLKSCGLVNGGLGTTKEMDKRDLFWVVHKLQVAVDHYPSWKDIVQLSTWSCIHGKHGYRRDWIIRDHKTGEVLIRAICFYALMNRKTRKLSKFCDEMKAEITPYFMDCDPIIEEEKIMSNKLDVDSDGSNLTHIVTRLSDLDMNQHVNNASYINFILESTPRWLLENYQLSGVTMKYLRECGMDKQLQSLTVPIKIDINGDDHNKREDVKFQHSILVDGIELVRGRTVWTPKPT